MSKTYRKKDHLRTLADDVANTPLAVRRGKGARASVAHKSAKAYTRKGRRANNFLTVGRYAEYYGINETEAEWTITEGRKLHEDSCNDK